MDISFRPATHGDSDLLLSLMKEYYAVDGIPFDGHRAASSIRSLLDSPLNGTSWLIMAGGTVAGYAVLTRCFSLEFGGAFGLLDELFVLEEHRGQGIGRAAVAFLLERCRQAGYLALRLEVETHNAGAARLYAREGFVRHDRSLMTLWLRADVRR